MGIITLLASILHRKSDTINNLGISSIIILLYNPYLLVDAGFLLSYAGTIGIIFFSKKISNGISIIVNKINPNLLNIEQNNNSKILFVKSIIEKIILYVISSLSVTISANIVIIPIMAYM